MDALDESELWVSGAENEEEEYIDEELPNGDPTNFTLYLGRTGEGGGYHVRNLPGQKQRATVSSFAAGSARRPAFSVRCVAKAIVHGMLDKASGIPASLLVYEFSFLSPGSKRIKEADVTFQFLGRKDDPATGKPTVKKVAPYAKHVMMQTTQLETRRIGAEAGVEGALGIASPTAKVNAEKMVEKTTTHAAEVLGDQPSDDWGNYHLAQWFLKENDSCNNGIVTLLRTCVLLVRKDDAEFTMNPTVRAKPDFRTWLRFIFSSRARDDPVIYDPTLEPYLDLESNVAIDPWNLGAADLGGLWDCTFHSQFSGAVKVSKHTTDEGGIPMEGVHTVNEKIYQVPEG